MKHDSPDVARRVLEWAGIPWDSTVLARLEEYHTWLRGEAIPAGVVGPDEGERLWTRHVGDSLAFASLVAGVESILDAGSGAGLPGVPLAIALPHTSLTLLDRSEARCRLLRRVGRILDLDNVAVQQADFEAPALRLPHEVAVARAFLPPARFLALAPHVLPQGRFAVVAASHGVVEPVAEPDWEVFEVPAKVLGTPAWMIRKSLSA